MTTATALTVTLLTALALVRATRLVTEDQIFKPFRLWLVDRLGQDSQVTYLFFCRWCLSVWLGAIAGAVLWWGTGVGAAIGALGVSWWLFLGLFTLGGSWLTGVARHAE